MYLLLGGLCLAVSSMAQTDTTVKPKTDDTLRVGNMIIIKKGDAETGNKTEIYIPKHHRYYRPSNVSTNWMIVDLRIYSKVIYLLVLALHTHTSSMDVRNDCLTRSFRRAPFLVAG